MHTITQEVAKLSKTVSELVISKQSGQSISLNQLSYSFSPQKNVQLTCYSCNFPGHKRKDCNWNGQFQPTPGKCQLCRQQGHPAYRCKTKFDGRQGNAQSPDDNRPHRQGYRK